MTPVCVSLFSSSIPNCKLVLAYLTGHKLPPVCSKFPISANDIRRIWVFEDVSLCRYVSGSDVSKERGASSTIKQAFEPEGYRFLRNFENPPT